MKRSSVEGVLVGELDGFLAGLCFDDLIAVLLQVMADHGARDGVVVADEDGLLEQRQRARDG